MEAVQAIQPAARRNAKLGASTSTAERSLVVGTKVLPAEQGASAGHVRRHVRMRAVDNGKLSDSLKELHRKREEMGLTIQDLSEIAGVPVGTVNKRFYDDSRDVPNPIREAIESWYAKWTDPANVARRRQIEAMSMAEIVDEWASWLGGANLSPSEKYILVAGKYVLDVNPLTIERQVSGKRERWKIQRIMRYEEKVREHIKELQVRAKADLPANDSKI